MYMLGPRWVYLPLGLVCFLVTENQPGKI